MLSGLHNYNLKIVMHLGEAQVRYVKHSPMLNVGGLGF
jgi:hypothetical protein